MKSIILKSATKGFEVEQILSQDLKQRYKDFRLYNLKRLF
jgi:hypothetical protein